MNTQIIELIDVTHDVTWLVWAIQYFFLIGISLGGLLLSLPAFVFGRAQFEKMGRMALIIALTTGIVAPVALISDLHQPGRFYNFYLHFTPGSWMSWGSYFLGLYLIALFAYAGLIYRARDAWQQPVIRITGGIAAMGALLVALYTGSEMGVLISRPLWNTAWMGVLFLVTGLSGAAGLGLLLNHFLGEDINTTNSLKHHLLLSLSIGLGLQLLWMLAGFMGLSASGAILLQLAGQYMPVNVIFLSLAVGSIVPLVLAASDKTEYAWLAGALAVVGAWMFRWNMFIGGQSIPKNGAGFYAFELPLGPEGLLGILGSLGLWFLMLLLITQFMPWQKNEMQAES